jgi:mono/diheme cytochrome c family protein
MSKLTRSLIFLLPLLFLSACSFSLAEDITPPPGSEQQAAPQNQTANVSGPLYPIVPPDPAKGAPIYAEKCAPCHGDKGLGNGEQATQLTVPVTAIGSPEEARQSTPAEWYTIITKGNLERFMPPFSNLSDRQRWDVVAYTYQLSETPELVAQGQALFAENCTRCHGNGGKGNGPDAAALSRSPSDLTDQELMAGRSAQSLFETITNGIAPDMPAHGEKLSEAERWALTAYLRSLTFAAATPVDATGAYPAPAEAQAVEAYPAPVDTQTGEAYPAPAETITSTETSIGTVRVQVVNGSGGEAPSDAVATLYGFDNMVNVFSQTLTTGENGVYEFAGIEMPLERVFMAGVEYGGGTYGSDIAMVDPTVNEMNLEVTVYDTTTDTSVLSTDRTHILFDFTDPSNAQIVEVFIISNPTNQSVVAAEEGGPVVKFSLPTGAANLQFQDGVLGERYVETPDGFADTKSVPPGAGQYQVVFAYEMPYKNKLEFAQLLNMNTSAVVVMLPDVSLKLKSDQFKDDGERDMQGTVYHLYSGGPFNSGDQILFTLSGKPKAGEASSPKAGSRQNLIIGVGVFGVALILAGVWLYRRNKAMQTLEDEETVEEEETAGADEALNDPDTLIDAIIALDDLYQAGKLPEEAYKQRRAELKARLKESLDR